MRKIKNNLAIDGSFIISYATKVAEIKTDKIVELGKTTATSARHIFEVGRLLNLPIERSKQKLSFEKLPYGANVI
jgi:hypothetical protein